MTKNSFYKDIMQPLDKVQRWYIRRPMVIFFTPLVILCAAIEGVYRWFKMCW